jgi:multidrug efflux pump
MRRTLGTAVFSGMLGVTLFGIFLTPVFFFVIDRMAESSALRDRWPGRWGGRLLDLLRLGFLWRPLVRGLRHGADAMRPATRRRSGERRSESLTEVQASATTPTAPSATVLPISPSPDLGPGALGTSSP